MTELPLLKSGSSGHHVMNLQADLQKLGFVANSISKGVSVDSMFGAGTERAVRAIQARSDLVPDGVVGSDTRAAISTMLAVPRLLNPWAPNWVPCTHHFWPVTSKQGWRSLGGQQQYHGGVDLGCPQGTKIIAPCSGSVVAIDHDHSIAGGLLMVRDYETQWGFVFCHLSRIDLELGDKVTAGTVVGVSGGTPGLPGAGYSTGAHLHVSAQYRGVSVDPTDIIQLATTGSGIQSPDRLN